MLPIQHPLHWTAPRSTYLKATRRLLLRFSVVKSFPDHHCHSLHKSSWGQLAALVLHPRRCNHTSRRWRDYPRSQRPDCSPLSVATIFLDISTSVLAPMAATVLDTGRPVELRCSPQSPPISLTPEELRCLPACRWCHEASRFVPSPKDYRELKLVWHEKLGSYSI